MCLDPRPDRLFRTRPARPVAAPSRRYAAIPSPATAATLNVPALRALERLAGDDELLARGWVVLSRQG